MIKFYFYSKEKEIPKLCLNSHKVNLNRIISNERIISYLFMERSSKVFSM